VVPYSAFDPWDWLMVLAWDFTEESRLYLSSFVAVLDGTRFWNDWVSDLLLPDPLNDGRSVAQQLCALVEFADEWVFREPAQDAVLVRFLERLNPRARILSLGGASHDLKFLALRVTAKEPGEALEVPRAAWRDCLISGGPSLSDSVSVFRSRRPFHPERFHGLLDEWPEAILRTEGTLWLASHPDLAFHASQAGPSSFELMGEGGWLATLQPQELKEVREEHPEVFEDWDPVQGDRQTELVFVWESQADSEFLQRLSACVLTDFETRLDWRRFSDPLRATSGAEATEQGPKASDREPCPVKPLFSRGREGSRTTT
jgi:G3E family GTPase